MKTFIVLKRQLVTEGDNKDKMPPQVSACMAAINRAVLAGTPDGTDAVGRRAERADVIKELTSGSELVTRQEPARILSFYQPKMAEAGLIEVVKEAEPKAEKPAGDNKGAAAGNTGGKGAGPKASGVSAPTEASGATA